MKPENTKRSPTIFFALFALSLTVAYWAIASVPYFSNVIYQYTDIDPLRLIGSGGVLGPKKIYAIKLIEIAFSLILIAGTLVTLGRPGRLSRLLILALLLPVIWISDVWIGRAMQGEYAERIHTTRLPTVDYDTIFDKQNLRSENIQSYADLYQAVETNYQKYSNLLKDKWKITDDQLLRTLFYLNTSANFFAYGNIDPSKPGGCANYNEQTGEEHRSHQQLKARYFLDTEIGCCTDYASVTHFLLDQAGIESRLLRLPIHGHWLNEVKIDGKWHALDANIGVFYQFSWNEIVKSKKPFQAILFPTLSFDITRPTYRPYISLFRPKTLMVAASGAERGEYFITAKGDLPPFKTMKKLK